MRGRICVSRSRAMVQAATAVTPDRNSSPKGHRFQFMIYLNLELSPFQLGSSMNLGQEGNRPEEQGAIGRARILIIAGLLILAVTGGNILIDRLDSSTDSGLQIASLVGQVLFWCL